MIGLFRLAERSWLIADSEALRNMARGFRDRQVDIETNGLLPAAGGTCGLLLAVWLAHRWRLWRRQRPPTRSPRKLFRELCRAHGLNWSARRLLRRLSRREGLDQPARLFLESARFTTSGRDDPLASHRDALTRLQTILFAAPATALPRV